MRSREDRARRERIEKHNQLDNLIYAADKTLREAGDKLPEDERKQVQDVLAKAREDLESDDAARLDAARQRVEQSTHRMAELLYKAQGQGAGAPGGGGAAGAGEAPKRDDVIDAEFTEEKGGSS
jgi:molecular chaperone DnaK